MAKTITVRIDDSIYEMTVYMTFSNRPLMGRKEQSQIIWNMQRSITL